MRNWKEDHSPGEPDAPTSCTDSLILKIKGVEFEVEFEWAYCEEPRTHDYPGGSWYDHDITKVKMNGHELPVDSLYLYQHEAIDEEINV